MRNSRRDAVRNALLVSVFALLVVAAVAWLRTLEPPPAVAPRPQLPPWRTEAPTPTPAATVSAADEAPAPDVAPTATPRALPATASALLPDRSAGTVQFVVRLRGPDGTPVSRGLELFVAETDIEPVDVAEWEFALAEGANPHLAPLRPEELARVAAWVLVVPTFDDATGEARVGPMELAAQPRFALIGWDDEFVQYIADVVPPSWPRPGDVVDLGVVEGRRSTSLVIELVGDGPPDDLFFARVGRIVGEHESEHARLHTTLLEMMAPETAFLFSDEAPLMLRRGEASRVVPLYPDPGLRVMLTRENGLAGEPIEVALTPHAERRAAIDLDVVFPAGGAEVDVRVRVVRGASNEPMSGATIRWADPGVQGEWRTDGRGEATIPALPLGEEHVFVVAPRGGGDESGSPANHGAARPSGPASAFFRVTPLEVPLLAEAGSVEREEAFVPAARGGDRPGWRATWRYPVYRWCVLELGGRGDVADAWGDRRPPYPIFVLQRAAQREGPWEDVPADEFLREEDTMAVSVTEDGWYRVAVAASPVWMATSEAGELCAGEDVVRVRLGAEALRPPAERRLLLRDGRSGAPLPHATVYALAEFGSLPPLFTSSDGFGEVALGPVAAERLRVTVVRPGGEEWETTLAPGEERGTERIEVVVP